jgi:hypothetical protein
MPTGRSHMKFSAPVAKKSNQPAQTVKQDFDQPTLTSLSRGLSSELLPTFAISPMRMILQYECVHQCRRQHRSIRERLRSTCSL